MRSITVENFLMFSRVLDQMGFFDIWISYVCMNEGLSKIMYIKSWNGILKLRNLQENNYCEICVKIRRDRRWTQDEHIIQELNTRWTHYSWTERKMNILFMNWTQHKRIIRELNARWTHYSCFCLDERVVKSKHSKKSLYFIIYLQVYSTVDL